MHAGSVKKQVIIKRSLIGLITPILFIVVGTAAADPIRIGSINSASGVVQSSQAYRNGAELAIAELNADGGLLGVVSIGDLVKWIITSQEAVIEQLHSYIAGQV